MNDGLTKPLFVFDLCREQAGLKDVDINARGSRHNSLLAILSVGAARLLSEAEAMAVVERRMPEFFKEPDCRQLIHDFYAKYHDDSKIMSATVQRINARAEQLAQLSKEKKDKDEEEPEEPADTTPANPSDGETAIPPIPGLKQSLTGVPEQMRMPALCALLLMAAAYASGENDEFGDANNTPANFTDYSASKNGKTVSAKVKEEEYLLNPMEQIGQQGVTVAPHWYIRHGSIDRDTAFPIALNLATKLENEGKNVNFLLAWNRPHSGDYALNELFEWLAKITK